MKQGMLSGRDAPLAQNRGDVSRVGCPSPGNFHEIRYCDARLDSGTEWRRAYFARWSPVTAKGYFKGRRARLSLTVLPRGEGVQERWLSHVVLRDESVLLPSGHNADLVIDDAPLD